MVLRGTSTSGIKVKRFEVTTCVIFQYDIPEIAGSKSSEKVVACNNWRLSSGTIITNSLFSINSGTSDSNYVALEGLGNRRIT